MSKETLFPNGSLMAVITYITSTTGPIPWDGQISVGSISIGSVNATITGGTLTSIANPIHVITDNSQPVTNDGTFATPANQTIGNTTLAQIKAALTNPLPVSGTVSVSGSVSATLIGGTITTIVGPIHVITDNSPTITNDGTFATPVRQDTGNSTLSSILSSLTDGSSAIVSQGNPGSSLSPWEVKLDDGLGHTATIDASGFLSVKNPNIDAPLSSILSDLNTSNNTLSSILANQIVPLGGPQAIAQNAYWVNHRLDEQVLIENMKQSIYALINSESENSQRMGFELR